MGRNFSFFLLYGALQFPDPVEEFAACGVPAVAGKAHPGQLAVCAANVRHSTAAGFHTVDVRTEALEPFP